MPIQKTALKLGADKLKAISQYADEGGTIQAHHLVAYFPGQPEKHTTASIRTVAEWISKDTGLDVEQLIEATWE